MIYNILLLTIALQTASPTPSERALAYVERVTAGCPKCKKRADKVVPIIIREAIKRGIDPLLAVFLTKRESSYIPGVTGEKGEQGLLQTGGTARAKCKKKYDLTTPEGQIMCGLDWLSYCYRKCKSTRGALYAYQTKGGKCSTPKPIPRIESRIEAYTAEANRVITDKELKEIRR